MHPAEESPRPPTCCLSCGSALQQGLLCVFSQDVPVQPADRWRTSSRWRKLKPRRDAWTAPRRRAGLLCRSSLMMWTLSPRRRGALEVRSPHVTETGRERAVVMTSSSVLINETCYTLRYADVELCLSFRWEDRRKTDFVSISREQPSAGIMCVCVSWDS